MMKRIIYFIVLMIGIMISIYFLFFGDHMCNNRSNNIFNKDRMSFCDEFYKIDSINVIEFDSNRIEIARFIISKKKENDHTIQSIEKSIMEEDIIYIFRKNPKYKCSANGIPTDSILFKSANNYDFIIHSEDPCIIKEYSLLTPRFEM